MIINTNSFPIDINNYRVLFGFLAALACFFLILNFSSDEMSNLHSYFIALSGGLLSISLLFLILKKYISRGMFLLAILFFVIKLLTGTIHYILLFDNDYFASSVSSFDYLFEYNWLFDSMGIISEGLSTGDNDALLNQQEVNKNYEMVLFLSMLFLLGGAKTLHFACFNSLILVLTSLFIYFIGLKVNGTQRECFFIFLVSLLQPFEFITSILARDTLGQFFIIFSVYFIISTHKLLLKVGWILLGSILVSFVREVYLVIPVAALVSSYFLERLTSSFKAFPVRDVIFLFAGLFTFIMLFQVFGSSIFSRFLDINFLSKIISLPISIIYALVGPFPWTQILLEVPGWEFHPPLYLQSIYNFTLILGTTFFLLNNHTKMEEKFILLVVSLFFLSGILVYGGKHVVYYSVAMPLLTIFFYEFKFRKFLLYFFCIFNFYIIANFLYNYLL